RHSQRFCGGDRQWDILLWLRVAHWPTDRTTATRVSSCKSIGSPISEHSSSRIVVFCWTHTTIFLRNVWHRFEQYGCHNLRSALQNDQYLESPTLLQSPIHIREPFQSCVL